MYFLKLLLKVQYHLKLTHLVPEIDHLRCKIKHALSVYGVIQMFFHINYIWSILGRRKWICLKHFKLSSV